MKRRNLTSALFVWMCLLPASAPAQSRIDLTVAGGVGHFNPGIAASGDQGLVVSAAVGIPISGSLAIAPQVSRWNEGINSFRVIGSELRWTPASLNMLQFSIGAGAGRESQRVLCSSQQGLCAADGMYALHYRTTSVVGTVGANAVLPIGGFLRPVIQVRVASVLGVMDDGRDAIGIAEGNALLYSIGIGLQLGGR